MVGQQSEATEVATGQGQLALANGGFTADMAVLTLDGPVPVPDLTEEHRVYALDLTTKLVKPKPVVDVQRVEPSGECIDVETRRANLCVAEDHRLVIAPKLGLEPRSVPARNLTSRSQGKFLNAWTTPSRSAIAEVDMTDFVGEYEICAEFDCHGHTVRSNLPAGCEPSRRTQQGVYYFDATTFEAHRNHIESEAQSVTIHAGPNHWRRPYQFDGDDFLEFLAWFVTEGSVERQPSSNTIRIKFAQKDSQYRSEIATLLDRLGFEYSTSDSGFVFSSLLFGRFLERTCGSGSEHKRIPDIVWRASDRQQEQFISTLIAGDGDEHGWYYTISDQLAADVGRLAVQCGIKPHYSRHDGTWRIALASVNDGFRQDPNVRTVPSPESLFRLTVADYGVVLAGRDGKFQWVGVSNVC